MTLYLDTTCWYRLFEVHTIQARINEQEAIISILEENEKSNEDYKILSCQMQVNQVYSKRNSLNTSTEQKSIMMKIRTGEKNTINNITKK